MDQRFYSTDISEFALVLRDQEAKHCAQVLRKQVGENIAVIDGKGSLYNCAIQKITKSQVDCTIVTKSYFEQTEKLLLAVAPPKNRERLEWMVEKATEIGIKSLILFTSQNSERSRINLERLEKKILSATKQSLRFYVPSVVELKLKDVLKTEVKNKFIAHCKDRQKAKLENSEEETLILIGPEGDFNNQEISLAEEANFKGLDLGNYRLRTETAALVATALFQGN